MTSRGQVRVDAVAVLGLRCCCLCICTHHHRFSLADLTPEGMVGMILPGRARAAKGTEVTSTESADGASQYGQAIAKAAVGGAQRHVRCHLKSHNQREGCSTDIAMHWNVTSRWLPAHMLSGDHMQAHNRAATKHDTPI